MKRGLLLAATALLVPGLPAHAERAPVAADHAVQRSADYLLGRAAGAGSQAWALTVDRDDDAPVEAVDRARGWSEPGAMRTLAERMSLSIARPPSTEARRGRQVTIGLRLQF